MKCGNFDRSDYCKNGQAGDQCPLLGNRVSEKGQQKIRVSGRKKQNKNKIMEPSQSVFFFSPGKKKTQQSSGSSAA